MTFHPEILSKKQKELLSKLDFLNKFYCYLAGGTGLSIQLGHRTSLDFDFYTHQKFSNKEILQIIKNHIKEVEFDSNQPEGTVQGKITEVHFSFFYYDYKLIHPLLNFSPIKLASLEDIAAMKIAAIIQRAKKRDFFDVYYLIQKLGFINIIKAAYQKYPWYEENNQIIFKSLTYFDEADRDEEIRTIRIFDKSATWTKVKSKLSQEVKNYLLRSNPSSPKKSKNI